MALTPATTLRVASFNIRTALGLDGRHVWPLRRHATLEAIEALDADVIGLQEVRGCQFRWLRRHLPGYDMQGSGRGASGGSERCPVLTRRATTRAVEVTTRWFGEQMDAPGTRLPGARAPRVATLAVVELDGAGVVVEVVNTHLDERPEPRLRSVRQLVDWLDDGRPHVLVGDLNAGPDSAVLDVLAAAGLRSAIPERAGGTAHRFTGRTDGRQIDHVLVSRHWTVVRGWVAAGTPDGGQLPSDHWPVVADIRLDP